MPIETRKVAGNSRRSALLRTSPTSHPWGRAQARLGSILEGVECDFSRFGLNLGLGSGRLEKAVVMRKEDGFEVTLESTNDLEGMGLNAC